MFQNLDDEIISRNLGIILKMKLYSLLLTFLTLVIFWIFLDNRTALVLSIFLITIEKMISASVGSNYNFINNNRLLQLRDTEYLSHLIARIGTENGSSKSHEEIISSIDQTFLRIAQEDKKPFFSIAAVTRATFLFWIETFTTLAFAIIVGLWLQKHSVLVWSLLDRIKFYLM